MFDNPFQQTTYLQQMLTMQQQKPQVLDEINKTVASMSRE